MWGPSCEAANCCASQPATFKCYLAAPRNPITRSSASRAHGQSRHGLMRIFVSGASGFVGTAVVRELVDRGHVVSGLARSDRAAAAVEAVGATVVPGDVDD